MELAKRFLDVGVFTNRIDEMRVFYGERIRLPFEELLPVGAGVRQYRYGLLGSVLKLNHIREPLPPRAHGGYKRLVISDLLAATFLFFKQNTAYDIELLPCGERGIAQIEIHIGV